MELPKFYYRTINDIKHYLDLEKLTVKNVIHKLWHKEFDPEGRPHAAHLLFGDGPKREGFRAIAFSKNYRKLQAYKNKHSIQGEIITKMYSRTGIAGLRILLEEI